MGHASAWDQRWWKGLNSHSPLAENVNGIELSQEELLQRSMEKRERDRLRARTFYRSELGAAYHQAYRNTEERKAYMKQYQERNRRHLLTTPSHLKMLAERKEGRALINKVSSGELDIEEVDQAALDKALKVKASNQQSKIRLADKTNAGKRADRVLYNQVQAGEVDATDPIIAQKVKAIAVNKENCSKWHKANKDTLLDKKRSRYQESVEAIDKVANGELDGEDPEVKKLCQVALSARRRATTAHEKKKQEKRDKEMKGQKSISQFF